MIFYLSLINKHNCIQLTLFMSGMENLYLVSEKKNCKILIRCLSPLNSSHEI